MQAGCEKSKVKVNEAQNFLRKTIFSPISYLQSEICPECRDRAGNGERVIFGAPQRVFADLSLTALTKRLSGGGYQGSR